MPLSGPTTTQAASTIAGPVYSGPEKFCGQSPLAGIISYDAHEAVRNHLLVSLRGLPPTSFFYIWFYWGAVSVSGTQITGNPSGSAVGSFQSDAAGGSVSSSVRYLRSAEARGDVLQITSFESTGGPHPTIGLNSVGILKPCS